jgi:acyl-CoA reductase-like NAD-dependent aldehyde dehydrogenase
MELSGNDAMFVLPGADMDLVAACIAYSLRLNGGATCIAPRRVFATPDDAAVLTRLVLGRVAAIPPAGVSDRVLARLRVLLPEAGAEAPAASPIAPIVVANARPEWGLLREDIFAPVVAIVPVADMDAALAADAACRYALGASVFGPVAEAMRLAGRVNAGSVVINDVIVPTADPRLPFGGRGASGFGVTRGAEGLLEMTTVKVITLRRGRFRPHLAEPGPRDADRFAMMIRLLYGRWRL